MELGEINISGTITVDGEARAISLKIPAGTKVEGTAGTRVALPVFAAGSTPSQTVDNAEKITAVTFGGDLAFSGPVRIEIEGAYSKRTGHIIGGRYTTVSTTVKTDTAEAAQSGLKNRDMVRVSNTSPKLVVWADGLNELVLIWTVCRMLRLFRPRRTEEAETGRTIQVIRTVEARRQEAAAACWEAAAQVYRHQ